MSKFVMLYQFIDDSAKKVNVCGVCSYDYFANNIKDYCDKIPKNANRVVFNMPGIVHNAKNIHIIHDIYELKSYITSMHFFNTAVNFAVIYEVCD